jgi:hypothetical protein
MIQCSGEAVCPASVKNYVSPERQQTFLRYLKTHTLNVTAACRSAGLAGTSGVYLQRRSDEDFRRQWEEVEEEVLDELESLQWNAAQESSRDRRWTLNRRRPTRWTERPQIASQVVSEPHVIQLSDEDLIRIAEGNEPQGEQ